MFKEDVWCKSHRQDKEWGDPGRSRCDEGSGRRAENCVLRWFGHVERMDSERMAKMIYGSGVEGRLGSGRPNMGWMEGVKSAFRARGLTLEQAREIVHDGPVCEG